MEAKVAAFINRGMRQDLSISKVDNEFAYHNHNIRITARDKDTLLSVTNEKGNKEITLKDINTGNNTIIPGIIIGNCVLGENLVLFSVDDTLSYIFKIIEKDDTFYVENLYSGNLKFDAKYPIETLGYYESTDIQKVYWVDGINQPRMINIKASNENRSKWIDTSFDFVTSISKIPNVRINKKYNGNGNFQPGVIQYAITYYNKFGQESNIVYTSPLYYLSMIDRGAKPDETVTCSLTLNISNCDTSFDYIRIYSITKNNYSGEANAKVIADLPIKGSSIEYTDNGTTGYSIDASLLNYIGGSEIIANTLNQKDGVLFLGGIETTKTVIKDLKDFIKQHCIESNGESKVISFERTIEGTYIGGNLADVYPYRNSLNDNSRVIKGFKYGERYRFGIRFISKTGNRTDAIWIGDKTNNLFPTHNHNGILRPVAVVTLPDIVVDKILKEYDFLSCELLMVNPTINDRSVLAQGIVFPTMFNLQQRCDNVPYSISSWFTRPKFSNIANSHFEGLPLSTSFYSEVPFVTNETFPYYKKDAYESFEDNKIQLMYWISYTKKRKKDLWSIGFSLNKVDPDDTNNINSIIYTFATPKSENLETSYVLFTQFLNQIKVIPDNYISLKWFENNKEAAKTSEEGNVYETVDITIDNVEELQRIEFLKNNREHYFIDESILNLYSPEIEENQHIIDNNDLKFRVVGYSRITSNISDYNIITKNQGLALDAGVNTFNFNTSANTYPTFESIYLEDGKYKRVIGRSTEGLLAFPLWRDYNWEYIKVEGDNEEKLKKNGWNVISTHTLWQVHPWQKEGSLNYQPLLDLSENTVQQYGNVISADLERKVFSNLRISPKTTYLPDNIWNPDGGIYKPRVYNSNESIYLQFETSDGIKQYQGNYDNLVVLGSTTELEEGEQVIKKYIGYNTGTSAHADLNSTVYSDDEYPLETNEPVRIKYKTTPHAVFSLKENNGEQLLLPNLINVNNPLELENYSVPWNNNKILKFKQDDIYADKWESPYHSYVLIGELYRDLNPISLYGGIEDNDLESNVFIPISGCIDIKNINKNLLGLEGDTYYQRWDCLKTYPYTEEDSNSVVDIISCMLETHINIDGRCDTNRNNSINRYARPSNFNILNKVYSQPNNTFPSFYLDEKFSTTKFPTQITWSQPKINSADIDLWTNINLIGTINLFGDRGKITSIQKYNDTLVAFQEKAISEIMFNSRTQLSTTDGTPIEIANTGKVDGTKYISDKIGCLNKWSIKNTQNGIYFIDDYNKSINCLSSSLINLSSNKGFDIWVKNNCTLQVWNPINFNNLITHYDSVNKDVYFLNDKTALVYSETLGEFTSFMDYQNTDCMINFNNHFLAYKNKPTSSLWLQNEGEYNMFFNNIKDYYITYRIKPDEFKDKLFTNIEYRADIWDLNDELTNDTFTSLEVKNEYQYAKSNLNYKANGVSNTKKKFRIWRADIPRDQNSKFNRDRIRNIWITATLKKDAKNSHKMVFHNFNVKYFE